MLQTDGVFVGRVAVVTGAGSGIGQAAAELFAQQGAAGAVVDRQGDRAQKVATSLRAREFEALAVECDVGCGGEAIEQSQKRARRRTRSLL